MPATSKPIVFGAAASHPTTPRASTRSQKRKADSLSPTKGSHGLANSTTPYRVSSAQRNKEGAGNSSTASRLGQTSKSTSNAAHATVLDTPLVIPNPPKQPEMDQFLEAEMQGAIFCDLHFVDNFLSVADNEKLNRILSAAEIELGDIPLVATLRQEKQLYAPLCSILNAIKRAVDEEHGLNNQPTTFVDTHLLEVGSHYDDIAGVKPDILWYDHSAHWETVRMPVEVKLRTTYLKAGMKQLTRYARAVFAHQLHRRHLYSLVVCEWKATMVRFDRSGILYSQPMDVREEEFRKAFVGLMMLDNEETGYDTAFTTRSRDDGRLEYYVDLPEEAFAEHEDAFNGDYPMEASTSSAEPGMSLIPRPPRTKRLKVVRVLCHRKTIRGRATTVLRIRPVLREGALIQSDVTDDVYPNTRSRSKAKQKQRLVEQEILGTRDFVLKLMWRDPSRKTEGEILERIVGEYGVGQHVWHSDVFKACRSSACARPVGDSCEACLDRTPDRNRVKISPNMQDLDIAVPEEKEDEEPTYQEVETDDLVDWCSERTSRTYCRLLTSTVGSPLCSARSPHELLRATLDAILGYWRLFNMGILHRDISDGNVLLLREPNGYRKRKWQEPVTFPDETNSELAESERLLQKELRELNDPTGILNDYDLYALHGRMGASFFDEPASDSDETESEEDEGATNERGSKRRKLNSAYPESSSARSDPGRRKATKQKNSTVTGISKAEKGVNRNIDFRTGTPSFMSTRILKLGVGRPYEHHFTDDLESFFWLILWCVIEHVDDQNTEPTKMARRLLRQIDRQSLTDIGVGKVEILSQCLWDGDMLKETLAECGNSWATDPIVVQVTAQLGSFFFQVYSTKSFMKCTPCEVFPKIVNTIKAGLGLR